MITSIEYIYLLATPKLEYDSRFNSQQSLKAGTTLTINVDFSGVPTPSAQWMLNGSEVIQDQRVTIKTSEYSSAIVVRGLSPKDAGIYKIDVKNAAGSANASFDIAVKG